MCPLHPCAEPVLNSFIGEVVLLLKLLQKDSHFDSLVLWMFIISFRQHLMNLPVKDARDPVCLNRIWVPIN